MELPLGMKFFTHFLSLSFFLYFCQRNSHLINPVMKKTFLLTYFIALLGAEGLAYDVRVDGIYYNLNRDANEAYVTSPEAGNAYSGTVAIPDSIEVEGEVYYVTQILSAFQNCPELKEVVLGRRINTFRGEYIFDGCHLFSLHIPANLTSVYGASLNLSSGTIESIRFESWESMLGIQYLHTYADLHQGMPLYPGAPYGFKHRIFVGDEELSDVHFPKEVTRIGKFVFKNCISLSSVTFPDGVEIETEAFMGCDNLTKLSLPVGTRLGQGVFFGCTNLKEVSLSEGVEYLEQNCFQNCTGLERIYLPGSLSLIALYAMDNCTSLKDIYYNTQSLPRIYSAFENTPIENAMLHVPEDMIETFRTTAPWSGFGQIVALQPGDMPTGVETIQEPLSGSHIGRVIYNLQGRRLTKRPERGMYIENGQVKIR